MFEDILNGSLAQSINNSLSYSFISKRLWRLASIGSERSTTPKGVENGVVSPCAFDLRPQDKSVSMLRLHVEQSPKDDGLENKKFMSRRFDEASLKKMASVYLDTDSLKMVYDDPETQKLMKHMDFQETKNSMRTHKNVCGYHWDLFFLCEKGQRLTKSSKEMKEDYIAQAKSLLAELSQIA